MNPIKTAVAGWHAKQHAAGQDLRLPFEPLPSFAHHPSCGPDEDCGSYGCPCHCHPEPDAAADGDEENNR